MTLNLRAPLSVSVVMCTYNGASFVKEQLLSVLNQTWPVTEILVFDDCSTDNTAGIVALLAKEYPVIRLTVNTANIGYNRNFEQAMKAASGDIIAPCDQDDIWMKDKLQVMIEAWDDKHPLIYCHSATFTGNAPQNPQVNPNFHYYHGQDPRKIFMKNFVSGHAMLIKKSLLALALPFMDDVFYDWWLAVVASYNGGVQYVEKALVLRRLHENNITYARNSGAEEQLQLQKRTLKPHLKAFLKAPGVPERHRMLLHNFLRLLEQDEKEGFQWSFFFFLLQHRNLFFSYKKKMISLFSHIKHSYRYAKV